MNNESKNSGYSNKTKIWLAATFATLVASDFIGDYFDKKSKEEHNKDNIEQSAPVANSSIDPQ